MGESITEATVGAILKSSGLHVAAEDEILELETDKVNQVLYAPVAGIIQWKVEPHQVVKVGDIIGSVEEGEASPPSPSVEKPEKSKASSAPAEPLGETKESYMATLKEATSEKRERDTLRESKEAYVALLNVSPPQKPLLESLQEGEVVRKPMSRIRSVIAQRLVEAQQNTASLTTFNEVDMTLVMGLREKYKESFLKKYGCKLGFMSFFVKAVIDALKEIPELNASIEGNDILYRHYYDIGIAVGAERGLVVPVLRRAENLSYAQIEQTIEAFSKKVKEGTFTVDDLQGGTFTITNGGVYGSLLSTPILNPPQSGILGMHKIEKRAVVIDDQIVIRPMMYIALTYDHRIVDGKGAVSFLVHVKNALEDPSRMLLDV